MPDRFVVRPDPQGFRVIDMWTGEPALIAMAPQAGLPETDARHMAELLNERARSEAGPVSA